MDDIDIARKYILQNDKVGWRRLYTELNKNRGLKVTQRNVKEIKSDIHDRFEKLNFEGLNKKVVFPFIGGWFFDIVDNRGKVGHEREAGFTKGWGVFCHGNSGYIVAFPVNSKSAINLTRLYNTFKQYCKNLPVVVYKHGEGRAQRTPKTVTVNYPIKTIVSDNEKGWGKNFDTNILKMTAKENHRFLSRINAFAGQLRKRYYNQGIYGNVQRYITNDEFDDFLTDWNLGYITFTGCTRGQMLVDKNLELAYIARALYYNENKNKDRGNAIQDDDVVQIREPDKKFNAPKAQNQLLPQKYKVVATEGNTLKLENIYNDQDVRQVHWNDVKARYKGGLSYIQSAKEDLKNVEVPKLHSNVVHFDEVDNKKKENLAKSMYVDMQKKWEQLGFPSEWRPKNMYEMANKLREKLDQDSFNYVLGEDINKKSLTPKIKQRIFEKLKKVENLQLLKQNIPKTDGFDQSGQLLTRRGNPYSKK